MAELNRTVRHIHRPDWYKIALPAAIGLLITYLSVAPIWAQSGCVGDPCVFETPTPGPTSTPTNTPAAGTPTAVPMPTAYNPFPAPYGAPTSIPLYDFPDVPSPIAVTLPAPDPFDSLTPTPFAMPGVISLTAISGPVTGTEAISLSEISTGLSISYSALITLDLTGEGISGTGSYTYSEGLIGEGQAVISDVVSYTTWLTGQVEVMEYTSSLTIATAPDWYAPQLPREMADIGWTFELLGSDMPSPTRYNINTWSYLIGSTVAMPIKLLKWVWTFFRALGPFGLFLIWLLVVMLPAVFGIKILLFLKQMVIRSVNFLLWLLDWLWKLWEAVPFIN